MDWRVARSLDVLLDEINDAAPNRSKLSDGSIGDAAHASRSSDHNPWVTADGMGIVRARDFTHDPGSGCDAGEIAERVRRLGAENGHPALGPGAYVIWNRRIASDTYGWEWRYYGGSNPHDKHCHVSVALSRAGYDSTARWGITESEEDEMAQYEDKLNAIHQEARAARKQSEKNGRLTYRRDVNLLDAVEALAGEVDGTATKGQAREIIRKLREGFAEDNPESGDDAPRG